MGGVIHLGKDNTEDEHPSGRQKISTADEQVDDICCMVLNKSRVTIQQIAKSIGINSGSVLFIFTKILTMSKLYADGSQEVYLSTNWNGWYFKDSSNLLPGNP